MKFNSQVYLLLLSIILFSIVGVSAEVNEYAPVKINECVTVKQVCSSCAYVNVSISYPNSTIVISNEAMVDNGGGVWTYEFCNTTFSGRYDVNGEGDLSGTATGFDVLWFEVTPSGSLMAEGSSLVLFGSLLIMIILSIVFLYIATKSEQIVAKVTLYSIAFIGFLMSVLYTVVTIQQVLFGYESIVNGIETFLFVGKIGVGLGVIALFIIILLIMLKAWKIKRGFDD